MKNPARKTGRDLKVSDQKRSEQLYRNRFTAARSQSHLHANLMPWGQFFEA